MYNITNLNQKTYKKQHQTYSKRESFLEESNLFTTVVSLWSSFREKREKVNTDSYEEKKTTVNFLKEKFQISS